MRPLGQHAAIGGIRLALGGNVFGWTADRDTSMEILDSFYASGGRMIDTADCYANGKSEEIIGEWLRSRGVRKDVLIGTKMGVAGTPGMLEAANVARALEAALHRLQTDYVDIFYAHKDEPKTPQDEVAAGFDVLVKAGKVRELGASNFVPERFVGALDSAARHGLRPYTILQPGFNLIWRENFPSSLQTMCLERGIAVLPYFGLASGFLTGKYRTEADLEKAGIRSPWVLEYARKGSAALAILDTLAAETGATHAQLSLAWLNAQPAVAAPLASGRNALQVRALCDSTQLVLTSEQLARLTAAHIESCASAPE